MTESNLQDSSKFGLTVWNMTFASRKRVDALS